jgi:hypothetical protein
MAGEVRYSAAERMLWLMFEGRIPKLIRDDRGVARRVFNRWSRVLNGRGGDGLEDAEFRRLWRRSGGAAGWSHAGIGVLAVLSMLLFAQVVWPPVVNWTLPANWIQIVSRLALAAFWVLAIFVFPRRLPARHSDELRGELLAMGRCASCSYRLGGVAVEADGCRVCPECGGAWRPI